jgi:hypothetical protein
MPKRLSDLEIEARVVPTMLRWPPPDVAKAIAWDRLRECVDALRGLLRTIDHHCIEAEQNGDFSPEGISRQRIALGQQALAELESFKPFHPVGAGHRRRRTGRYCDPG